MIVAPMPMAMAMAVSTASCFTLPSPYPGLPAVTSSLSFAIPSSRQTAHNRFELKFTSPQARLGGGGAGVLERPGLDQSQTSQEPRVEEGGEMGKLPQRRTFGGGDRYRVLLLDHERHTESQVASVLPKVVPSVTPDEARKCFRESRDKGIGLVTVAVKEHAEFYAQMMARCGLRSGIEPDSDTL